MVERAPIMDRSGQQILIWGAERLTCALLAETYLAAGAEVRVLDDGRGRHERLPEAVGSIECDPGSPRDLRKLKERMDEDEQGLDVLVILHEDPQDGNLENNTPEEWQEALKHNVHLPLQVVQACLGGLKTASGNIAFLGSIGGPYAFDGFGPIGVARQGLHNLSRYMTMEWLNDGIRVNVVAVGVIVETGEETALRIPRAHCLYRKDHEDLYTGYALPGEIVDIFDFITSDRARWLTGQTLTADGGMTLCLDFDYFLRETDYT